MKRSEINTLIEEAKALLEANNIRLPPFAYWAPEDWKGRGSEVDEIRACRLGWDLSDFGAGRFRELGLTLFTIRNGHNNEAPYNQKTYCEKILIVGENQVTPMHYQKIKMEPAKTSALCWALPALPPSEQSMQKTICVENT